MITVYLFENNLFDKKDIFLNEEIIKHCSIHRCDEETYKSSLAAYKLLTLLGKEVYFENDIPALKEGYVSVSHCKNYVLVAINSAPVGADVEIIRPFRHELIKKVLPEEIINKLSQDSLNENFFKEWTAKEAYVKRLRTGLTSFPKDIITEGWIYHKILESKFVIALSCEASSSVFINEGADITESVYFKKSKELHLENISSSDKFMLQEHEEDNEENRMSLKSENFVTEKSDASNAFEKRYFSDYED